LASATKPEAFASPALEKLHAFWMPAMQIPDWCSHLALISFAKQLLQIVHHAAAPDIRDTRIIWLSTLRINLPSIDHQCHVMPSGLKKYGWEAHDGKFYGRQELFDEHFHLTTSWVSVCIAYLPTSTNC